MCSLPRRNKNVGPRNYEYFVFINVTLTNKVKIKIKVMESTIEITVSLKTEQNCVFSTK